MKLSPLSAPVMVLVKAGLAAPYERVALFAATFRVIEAVVIVSVPGVTLMV